MESGATRSAMAGTMAIDREWGLLKAPLVGNVSAKTAQGIEACDMKVRAQQFRRMVSTGDRWGAFVEGARRWIASRTARPAAGAITLGRFAKRAAGKAQGKPPPSAQGAQGSVGVPLRHGEEFAMSVDTTQGGALGRESCDALAIFGRAPESAPQATASPGHGRAPANLDEMMAELDDAELDKLEAALAARRQRPRPPCVADESRSLASVLEGPLVGLLPSPLERAFEDTLTHMFGDEGFRKAACIERAHWSEVVARLLESTGLGAEERVGACLRILLEALQRFLPIAGDNMREITAAREEQRQQQLKRDGWVKGRGEAHGRNDCLADSLLQSLSHAGVLPHYSIQHRCEACRLNRQRLSQTVELPPEHRPKGAEFLQENIHSGPSILFFLEHFRSEMQQPVPPGGFAVIVHSVWSGNGGESMIPPSMSRVCQGDAICESVIQLNLYNTTDGGVSGLHFDPLFGPSV